MGCDIPSVAVENSEYFSIFLYIGRYDMDMLMFGIVVPDHDIGLFPIAHVIHIFFGDFIESFVVKVFPMWKVQTDMDIAILGGVALSLKMKYVTEELWRYVLRKRVTVTEYQHAFFAEDIVQCPFTGFAINDLSYHPVRSSIVILISAYSSSLVLSISRSRSEFGLLKFLWCAILTSWLMLFPILLIW